MILPSSDHAETRSIKDQSKLNNDPPPESRRNIPHIETSFIYWKYGRHAWFRQGYSSFSLYSSEIDHYRNGKLLTVFFRMHNALRINVGSIMQSPTWKVRLKPTIFVNHFFCMTQAIRNTFLPSFLPSLKLLKRVIWDAQKRWQWRWKLYVGNFILVAD